MAGILQTNPWSYGPYTTLGAFAPVSIPGAFVGPQVYGQPSVIGPLSPFAPPQIHQLQQLLQILPQQIQQLQQTIQFLPQQVAQVVVQTLIQSQANVPSFGQTGLGVPFQSIPTVSPFAAGQPGYVM